LPKIIPSRIQDESNAEETQACFVNARRSSNILKRKWNV
jgi:hypothetical protein